MNRMQERTRECDATEREGLIKRKRQGQGVGRNSGKEWQGSRRQKHAVKEAVRSRGKQTVTNVHIHRVANMQTYRKIKMERDPESKRETARERERERERERKRIRRIKGSPTFQDKHRYRRTSTYGQTDRQASKQIGGQTGRQTEDYDRHTVRRGLIA